MNIECPWRFGERFLTTDFIQHKNVAIQEVACSLAQNQPSGADYMFVAVSKWVRDNFSYPLSDKGEPAADGFFKYGKNGLCSCHYQKQVPYMWQFPNEVINTKHGICIDTANLAVSVAVALGINAWVILGEVRSANDGQLVGYHAWLQSPYKQIDHIIETTVHEAGANNIVLATDAYDPKSAWAKSRNLYYVPQAHFNHEEYVEKGPLGARMPMLLGLPFKRSEVLGMQYTMAEVRSNPQKTGRAWRKEEAYLMHLLNEAYRIK